MMGDPPVEAPKNRSWLVAVGAGFLLHAASSGCVLDSAGLYAPQGEASAAGGGGGRDAAGSGGAGTVGSGVGGAQAGSGGGGVGGGGLPPVDVTLQASDDTHVDLFNGKVNFGASIYMRLHGSSHPLLRFEMDKVPKGSTILSATLSLNMEGANPQAMEQEIRVHAILSGNSGWKEGVGNASVAGNGDPSWVYKDEGLMKSWAGGQGLAVQDVDFKATPEHTIKATFQAATRYEWPISAALVQEWADNDEHNHGLIVRTLSGYHYFITSSESPQTSLRPSLRVMYQPPK